MWLSGLQAGIEKAPSEPLSTALWLGFASLLRAAGVPVAADTAAVFSVLCGLLATTFAWRLAREVTHREAGLLPAMALMLTLGVTQLYCGYIESYPPVAALVLGYLWLGLRRTRGVGSPLLLPVSFALCVASHFATVALAPSYLLAALRGPESFARRVALAAGGFALAVALLLLLGSNPHDWSRSLGAAARGAETGHLSTTLIQPAYGVLSGAHIVDFMNALLLVLPVPLLLLVARLAERRGRVAPLASDTRFLALAAAPGVALAALLRLPLPPAQDWDLASILLLPGAVFSVRAGQVIFSAPGAKRLRAGLVTLAVGSLLSFVLVNANQEAATRRFETILAPGAKITSFARAYGNYSLWKFFSERGDHAAAHLYALRALEAEPGNPRYWTNVGLDLYRLGRYDEALPYLESGVRRGPDRWEARYDLGLCYNAKGRYADAAEMLRVAVQTGGDRPDVLHNLGIALYRSGHPDSALAIWQGIVSRWPEYAAALQRGDKIRP